MYLLVLGDLLTMANLVVEGRQITLDIGIRKPHQTAIEVRTGLVIDITGKARQPVCKMLARKIPLCTTQLISLHVVTAFDCLYLLSREK